MQVVFIFIFSFLPLSGAGSPASVASMFEVRELACAMVCMHSSRNGAGESLFRNRMSQAHKLHEQYHTLQHGRRGGDWLGTPSLISYANVLPLLNDVGSVFAYVVLFPFYTNDQNCKLPRFT